MRKNTPPPLPPADQKYPPTSPLADVAEKVADQGRDLARIGGRVDAISTGLRKDQAETIREHGLPADLVGVEQNALRRISPFRSRWPEIAAFDERVDELEVRQAAKAAEAAELHDREISAPAAHEERLATWQLDGEQGPRPEPELPKVREQIEQRREEREALDRAKARVLNEKARYVEKHRDRLVKEADSHADQAHRRYLELIDELAEARAELYGLRRAAVWARLYPDEHSARETPDTFAGGRKRPLQAIGLNASVAPDRILDGLRADADWLREAATPEQRLAIQGRDPRQPPNTEWANDPAVKAERDRALGEWLTSR